ncbi:MAG TPA: TetR/AcrR family transcriptional regulator [Gammaproteobacteria bacterium]
MAESKKRAPARKNAKRHYHHGDLRRALLGATEALLESSGVEGFTLREVARRAGVSHGAPAHHFGDVRGLLSEFTAESFAQLSESMRRRRAEAASGAFEQLVASGIGYVEYALAHPARFQLMFRSERLDSNRASLAAAGAGAFGQLVECIDRVSREAGAPPDLDTDKIALAWSIVHGFATLAIDNRNFAERVSGGSRARALATVRRLLESSRAAFERRG